MAANNNNNNNQLTIGKSYICITASGVKITPIHILSNDKAIFTTDAFAPTPFVEWLYRLNPDGTISVSNGIYYQSLHRALRGSLPEYSIVLRIFSKCPTCGHTFQSDIQLTQDLDFKSIVETIEDECPCSNCGNPFTHITQLTLVDEYDGDEYTIYNKEDK